MSWMKKRKEISYKGWRIKYGQINPEIIYCLSLQKLIQTEEYIIFNYPTIHEFKTKKQRRTFIKKLPSLWICRKWIKLIRRKEKEREREGGVIHYNRQLNEKKKI